MTAATLSNCSEREYGRKPRHRSSGHVQVKKRGATATPPQKSGLSSVRGPFPSVWGKRLRNRFHALSGSGEPGVRCLATSATLCVRSNRDRTHITAPHFENRGACATGESLTATPIGEVNTQVINTSRLRACFVNRLIVMGSERTDLWCILGSPRFYPPFGRPVERRARGRPTGRGVETVKGSRCHAGVPCLPPPQLSTFSRQVNMRGVGCLLSDAALFWVRRGGRGGDGVVETQRIGPFQPGTAVAAA